MIPDAHHHKDPARHMRDQEFDLAYERFGSFVSMLHNKRLNKTMLFILLLKNPKILEVFKLLSETDDVMFLFKEYIKKNPTISKSKLVYRKVAKYRHKLHGR